MSFQELEELVRKYLSTGIAVVVILVAPGTDAAGGGALPSEPSITVIEPGMSGSPADERTGAAGRDPERRSDAEADDTGSSGSASGAGSQDSGDDSSGDTTDNAPRSTDGSGGSSADAGANDDDTPDDHRNGTGDNNTSSTTGTENDSDENESSENDSSESDMSSGSRSGGTGSRDTGNEAENDRSGTASRSGSSHSDSESDAFDSGHSDTESDAGSDSGNRADGSRDSAGAGSVTESGANAGITAAEQHGWGTPDREDDFSSGTDQWDIYDGPGHGGEGTRSPSAVSVEDGILTITGDSSGTTAGMAWNPGQKYGRWEGRVRAPVSDPSYNALLLLWPDAEDFPVGGEIDFMEMMDHNRQKTDIFIHYGKDNSQVNGSVEVDGTEWHNWALEWTPEAITAYVDGEEWYRTTDTSIFPPGPMHLCIQLDWFPDGDTPKQSIMEVDWVRQYSLDGSTSDNGATGKRSSAGEDERGSAEDRSRKSNDRDGDNEGDDDESPVRELLRRLFSWK
ncbi:MAG TPA: family 16 glycosylhydrolase [Pseudonocardia sp.]